MIDLTFKINGAPVDIGNFANEFEKAIVSAAIEEIREKLAGVRDPESGEFPVITVRGSSLKSLSIVVSGSDKVVALANEILNPADPNPKNQMSTSTAPTPQVFLSHASEDKPVARQIAKLFQENGIETFFDEWDINPGDSLRQKIDEALGKCTHFVVLVTQTSLKKNWVAAEIDAGFGRKIAGGCKFIALRSGVKAHELPPLLASLHSPALGDLEANVLEVIKSIHGVSKKPPLGPVPSVIRNATPSKTGLSPGAEAIARLMCLKSEHGDTNDPQMEVSEIRTNTNLSDNEIVDAVDELESKGALRKHIHWGCGEIWFGGILADRTLFTEWDRYFTDWNPEADAKQIATDLVNEVADGNVKGMAEKYGWSPRRMNPAINFLVERNVVEQSESMGGYPFTCISVWKSHQTRRYVDHHC